MTDTKSKSTGNNRYMNQDLKELAKLAKKATAGEWKMGDRDHNGQRRVVSEHNLITTCHHECVGALERTMNHNAAFIAAAKNFFEKHGEDI